MKITRTMNILMVILLLLGLGFTTKVHASSVTGRPLIVKDRGIIGPYGGHTVIVGMDTGLRNGKVDWQRTLEGVSTADAQLLVDAKREGFDVTIKYHTVYDAQGKPHFICDRVTVSPSIVSPIGSYQYPPQIIDVGGALYYKLPDGELIYVPDCWIVE